MDAIKEVFLTEEIVKFSKEKEAEEFRIYLKELFDKAKPYILAEFNSLNDFLKECYNKALDALEDNVQIHILSELLLVITKDSKVDFNNFFTKLKDSSYDDDYIELLIHFLKKKNIENVEKDDVGFYISFLTAFINTLPKIDIKADVKNISKVYINNLFDNIKFSN